MLITDLRVVTRDVAAQRAFYAGTLELPVREETAAALTLQVGATRLTFEATTAREEPVYHIAFNIPRTKLAAAKEWLATRAPLLTADGRDDFVAESWDARMVYFRDPAGNILECIARQTLPNDRMGPFDPRDLLSVSEIGLPVDDVPVRVAALEGALGIAAYKERSATFAPLGDEQGLLIVVTAGRPWFPTATRAVVAPARLTLRGAREAHDRMPSLPYEITVTRGLPDEGGGGCDGGVD